MCMSRYSCDSNALPHKLHIHRSDLKQRLLAVLLGWRKVEISPVSGCLQHVRVVHVPQDVQRALGRHLQPVRDEDGAPQFEDELPDDGRVGAETAAHALDERVVALDWHRHAQQHRYHEKLVGL